jgi:hypothetical protein
MDEVISAKMELGVESLDNTTRQSVAGQHLATMSETSRSTVAHKLNKTVKSARNEAVKQDVLEEEYTTKLLECTVAHLKQSQSTKRKLGSKLGTPTEPTFPLKFLWEHCLIPSVEKLLAPDGPCYGAQVILQEDNAGPHTEHNYTSWLKSEFELHKWRIELQAPQGQLLHYCTISDVSCLTEFVFLDT